MPRQIKGKRILKNGVTAGYVKQKDGSWRFRFLKKQRGGEIEERIAIQHSDLIYPAYNICKQMQLSTPNEKIIHRNKGDIRGYLSKIKNRELKIKLQSIFLNFEKDNCDLIEAYYVRTMNPEIEKQIKQIKLQRAKRRAKQRHGLKKREASVKRQTFINQTGFSPRTNGILQKAQQERQRQHEQKMKNWEWEQQQRSDQTFGEGNVYYPNGFTYW